MRKTIFLIALLVVGMTASAVSTEEAYIQLRDSIVSTIHGAKMPSKTLSLKKFDAKGDGKSDCRPAFERAMRQAKKYGGARIVVPAGTYYVCGPIRFESNVCLDLQEGATIKFSPNPKYYPIVETSWEGTFVNNYSPFIYGKDLHDVAIVGKGTIDGNAQTTFATWRGKQEAGKQKSRDYNHRGTPVKERVFGEGDYLRPQLIQFYNCRGVTIEGVFITNSPFWCIHLLKSRDIICRGLRYDAKLVNNDGIDPEYSRDILIEDIDFNNGDDNVAVKSGRDNDGWATGQPTENLVIRNCRFKGLHGVVLGSEMSGGIRNVIVENCVASGYCKRGFYVKTNPDRGGYVKNIYIRNCEFDEVEDLFYVTTRYAGEGMDNNHYAKISDISVDGLKCRKVRKGTLVIQGIEACPVERVALNRIEVGDAGECAIDFSHALDVTLNNSTLGEKSGVPTMAK